jgi:hypothetical protein
MGCQFGCRSGTRLRVIRLTFRPSARIVYSSNAGPSGDIETSPVTILRVERDARTHPLFPGAVVDRVLQVPVGLLR